MKADNPFANVKLAAPRVSESSEASDISDAGGTAKGGGFTAFTNINPFLSSSGNGFLSTASMKSSSQSKDVTISTAPSKGSVGFADFKDPFKAMRDAANASSSKGFLCATSAAASGAVKSTLGLTAGSSLGSGLNNSGSKGEDNDDNDNEGDANYDPEAEVVVTIPEGEIVLYIYCLEDNRIHISFLYIAGQEPLFKPTIDTTVPLKTGEEDENCLYQVRGKLFRYRICLFCLMLVSM